MSTQECATIKSTSLLRAGSLVSLMTLLSRVLGFARDVLIAQIFGVSAGIDAFFVAFKIPNFMRRLFAEGAFSQAFVPVLAEYQKTSTEDKLKSFIARIAGNLFLVLLLVTLTSVLISPLIIRIFAPGFSPDSSRFLLASQLLKITFPYLLLVSMTALCGAVLNTFGRFAVPSFTPVLLNVSMILSAIFLAPLFETPVFALALGVFLGGLAQLAFQIPFLYRAKILVKPEVNWQDSGVKRVLKLMVPALFGVSVSQINLLIDTVFASFLTVGSVSWLYYSDRLTFFPLGVFGVAIATVILPHLSRVHTSNNQENYSSSLDWGIRLIVLIALPSTLGLIIFSKPLLITLFAYGKFSMLDVMMTAKSLTTFSLGILAFMLIKVLAAAFYATQDIKTPVKIGAVAMLVNTLFCFLLIKPLAHAGLALASSIAAYINAGLLLMFLLKRGIYSPAQGWFKFVIQVLLANTAMVILLFVLKSESAWTQLSAISRIATLMFDICLAVIIYILSLYLSGLRLSQFRNIQN